MKELRQLKHFSAVDSSSLIRIIRVESSWGFPEKMKITHRIKERRFQHMIEKFTEDMFNLHYFSIHRKCALYEFFKSYTEDGEGMWIHRHSVQ